MEKSWDSIKGTIQHLTLSCTKKGYKTELDPLQTRCSHLPFLSLNLFPNPALTTQQSPMPVLHQSQNQYPYLVDTMKGSFARPANTPSSTIMCSGKWDDMSMKDTPVNVPSPQKTPSRLNHLLYPKLSNPDQYTPSCKKCDASYIKRYCPNFTCPYCWTTASGHWPNKCPKKMFQKYWWKKGTKRNEDQDSTQSWDDCRGFYNISGEEDSNLNGECWLIYLQTPNLLHPPFQWLHSIKPKTFPVITPSLSSPLTS